jgi:hypothetical protein
MKRHRYEETSSISTVTEAKAKHYQLSFSKQLAYFILSEKNRKKLNYKATRSPVYNSTDELDGYEGDISGGFAFKSRNNNVEEDYNPSLSFHYDGFQPFDTGDNSMTIIMFTINNIPPEQRYKANNSALML